MVLRLGIDTNCIGFPYNIKDKQFHYRRYTLVLKKFAIEPASNLRRPWQWAVRKFKKFCRMPCICDTAAI
jgi:hypothetical protein